MPLHRIPKGDDPAGALKKAITDLEQRGEAVVRWDELDGEWLLLTRPPKRSPVDATVEYRRLV